MPANKKLLVLPGDGIGPEVVAQVRRIVEWMDRRRAVSFDTRCCSGRSAGRPMTRCRSS
jgi:3-isopropylmalate dehydrogenase